jgi:hypothetical protein
MIRASASVGQLCARTRTRAFCATSRRPSRARNRSAETGRAFPLQKKSSRKPPARTPAPHRMPVARLLVASTDPGREGAKPRPRPAVPATLWSENPCVISTFLPQSSLDVTVGERCHPAARAFSTGRGMSRAAQVRSRGDPLLRVKNGSAQDGVVTPRATRITPRLAADRPSSS